MNHNILNKITENYIQERIVAEKKKMYTVIYGNVFKIKYKMCEAESLEDLYMQIFRIYVELNEFRNFVRIYTKSHAIEFNEDLLQNNTYMILYIRYLHQKTNPGAAEKIVRIININGNVDPL